MSLVMFLCRKNDINDVDTNQRLLSSLLSPLTGAYEAEATINSKGSAGEFLSSVECAALMTSSLTFHTFGYGMIIDCDSQCLKLCETVEACRKSLVLDSKRPTVNRRFFHDINGSIVQEIESAVFNALVGGTQLAIDESSLGMTKHGILKGSTKFFDDNTFFHVYCNRYIRILEYDSVGIGLAPHTDGSKVCDATRNKSTHTLLLYLSDCDIGGETVIVDNSNIGWYKCSEVVVPKDRLYKHPDVTTSGVGNRQVMDVTHGCAMSSVCLGVSPRIGRIFLFPHEWPHAGAVCRSVPKIVLRAELTIQYATTNLHGQLGR